MKTGFRSNWPAISAVEGKTYQPKILDPSVPVQRAEIDALMASEDLVSFSDFIVTGLAALIRIRRSSQHLGYESFDVAIERHLAGVPAELYGRYVFLPWSRALVHVLPDEEYCEVLAGKHRAGDNSGGNSRLSDACIGILGSDVGLETAMLLASTGVGAEFRIASAGKTRLSDSNRARNTLSEIGLDKGVSCARRLYEINPYLKLALFNPEEANAKTEFFVIDGKKLNLFIEDSDDLITKIEWRAAAKKNGIPSVMYTMDRKMLDIERFDLEPQRRLLHGLLDNDVPSRTRNLTEKEKSVLARAFAGERPTNAPKALISSVQRHPTAKNLPKLASGVKIGSAVMTHVAQSILIGGNMPSGRSYIETDDIFPPDTR